MVHKAGLVLCETTGHRWWWWCCVVLCCNLDMGHHHTEPGHHWHSDRKYGSWVVGQHTALYHCNLFSLSTCHHMSRAQHCFPAESLETAAGDIYQDMGQRGQWWRCIHTVCRCSDIMVAGAVLPVECCPTYGWSWLVLPVSTSPAPAVSPRIM